MKQEGQEVVAETIRSVLQDLRSQIVNGLITQENLKTALANVETAVGHRLRCSLQYSLRSVINATGVILHTNLGRAPLSPQALDHICEVAGSYSNLELNLDTGDRGQRDMHVQNLFERFLGRLDGGNGARKMQTIVVNNCAAAVLIALNTLAEGGTVIVSRGELVEIGGSFRIPDVMAKSGSILCEVGTTNRTSIRDYERAISQETRLLLRVHRSNFAIVGFTQQPTLPELVALGRKHKIPVFEDQGNGSLVELRDIAGVNESNVADSLRTGVDLVSYSGDKLLGGPQAGLLTGRTELVKRIRTNPLFRALRADKLTYAALEATLLGYIRRDHPSLPILRMLETKPAEVLRRSETLKELISGQTSRPGHLNLEIMEGRSLIGGGTAPTSSLPTYLLAVTVAGRSADHLQKKLRENDPPIICRVEEGQVLLDLRTVSPEQDKAIAKSLVTLSAS